MAAHNRKVSLKGEGGISLEHSAGSKSDKNRRHKSAALQFTHTLTGETVKERQVKKLLGFSRKIN